MTGHFSLVQAQQSYYTPCHVVVKTESTTTKLHGVYYASSHACGPDSLNEHMGKERKVNADMIWYLIRFRLFQIALTADI